MLGLVCKATNTDVVAAGYDAGVLTVPAGDNVVRILPALTITEEEIAEASPASTPPPRRSNDAPPPNKSIPFIFPKISGEREGADSPLAPATNQKDRRHEPFPRHQQTDPTALRHHRHAAR
jgi:hypothetical protein